MESVIVSWMLSHWGHRDSRSSWNCPALGRNWRQNPIRCVSNMRVRKPVGYKSGITSKADGLLVLILSKLIDTWWRLSTSWKASCCLPSKTNVRLPAAFRPSKCVTRSQKLWKSKQMKWKVLKSCNFILIILAWDVLSLTSRSHGSWSRQKSLPYLLQRVP